jgi:hypothetical protein
MTVSHIHCPTTITFQFVTGCKIHPADPYEWFVTPLTLEYFFFPKCSYSERYGDQRDVAIKQFGLIDVLYEINISHSDI